MPGSLVTMDDHGVCRDVLYHGSEKMPSFLHMLQLQELDGTTALFVVKLSGDVLTSG
jgi:hypothetical protein